MWWWAAERWASIFRPTLLEHGHEPVLIERDHKKCQRIANLLDLQVICGDGSSLDALQSADLAHADALARR